MIMNCHVFGTNDPLHPELLDKQASMYSIASHIRVKFEACTHEVNLTPRTAHHAISDPKQNNYQ